MGGNTVGNASREVDGVPKIGAGVIVGAGTKILGAITIGKNSKIGANAVVMTDMPENGITIIKPTRSTSLSGKDAS